MLVSIGFVLESRMHRDGAFFGKLDSIANEIRENLSNPSWVTNQGRL